MNELSKFEQEIICEDWELLNLAFEALLRQNNVCVMQIGAFEVYLADTWGVGVLFRPAPSVESEDIEPDTD